MAVSNNAPEGGKLGGEPTSDAKGSQAPRMTRGSNGRGQRGGTADVDRFFLAKAASNGGLPVLGNELKTEAEAIGESFKTGLPYFVLSERKGVADFAGRTAQLRGEPVRVPQKGDG